MESEVTFLIEDEKHLSVHFKPMVIAQLME